MIITKILDEESVVNVERYAYEFEARKSVIAEMLSQNMDTSTAAFDTYQHEMTKYKVLYETAKKEFENKFVADVEGWTNWELNYGTRTLSITVPGGQQ